MTDKPLAGIKVVELARILAGPWCGQVLADLGADVIKVENPQGDDTRRWGPPFIERQDDRTAAYFYSCNRGKRSVTADFRDADDLQRVKSLISKADVVIENFKVGGLEKFGLDYPSLSVSNPRLVYCAISGFGQTGPRSKQPGYDLLIQGMSGVMDITGEPSGAPQKMGVAFVDIFSGLYATIGIQTALLQRESTGKGQYVDIALLDSMVGVLANQGMNYFINGVTPKRAGNRHPNLTPYETIETADGYIIIAIGNDRQFEKLCEALGITDELADGKFANNQLRLSRQEQLMELINSASRQFKQQELFETLTNLGVPAGPINTVEQAYADQQVVDREMQISPEGVPGVRTPIIMSGNKMESDKTAPTLGGRISADTIW